MRTVWSFFIALLVSMLASQLVAQQLAIWFRSREEFIAVMALLLLFTIVSIVVFSLVFVVKDAAPRAIDRAALVLGVFAAMAVAAATLFGMSQSAWALPSPYDLKLIAEILPPALIAVAVQWWFVRRRSAKGA